MRVFVTTELYPFTAGGIGRVIGNILATSTSEELQNTAIVLADVGLDPQRFEAIYPQVSLIHANANTYQCLDEQGRRFPPQWAFSDSVWHWRSVCVMQALRRLEQTRGNLDYIEFPDWGGLGFAAIQEKRLGLAFQKSVIAVRLNTTEGILLAHEDRAPSLALYDIERKALADCDCVVAQLPTIAEAVGQFYGFDRSEWMSRVHINAPPVLLDVVSFTANPSSARPIVFASKIQHIKRPEVFVRGCAGFLASRPDYRGTVFLVAHAFDDAYLQRISCLIPAEYAGRFCIESHMNQTERARLIASSICVFSSVYEAFCLAAYEASLSGALCVLNESDPAFGDNTPWIDGLNCLKFDGSTAGLCDVLHRAVDQAPQLQPVSLPNDPPPWKLAASLNEQPVHPENELPLVSVIIPHYNMSDYLGRTLDQVLHSTAPNLEVILVDDASTDIASRMLVERLAELKDIRLRVVRSSVNNGLAGARNLGLKHAQGKYTLILDADDLVGYDFIALAVKALERNPNFDFVIPQAAFFVDSEEQSLETRVEFSDYAVFYGEALASGFYQNRYSTATMLARTEVLRNLGYREDLNCYEDWELYLRAVTAGRRMLVTNSVYFFYRQRPNSMVHASEVSARGTDLCHAVLRDKQFKLNQVTIPLYALYNYNLELQRHFSMLNSMLSTEIDMYRNSEVVFMATKIAGWTQHHLPWLIPITKQILRSVWRFYKAIRSRMSGPA